MATRKSTARTTKNPVKAEMPVQLIAEEQKGAVVAAKKSRAKRKVVRDSFTMPYDEHRKIEEIKELCAKAGLPVKKSEVLRAALKALATMSPPMIEKALADLEKIKTGRPKKP